MPSLSQRNLEEVSLMLQTAGWKIVDEKLQERRRLLLEDLVYSNFEEARELIKGIDLLYKVIHDLEQEVKFEKQQEKALQ